MTNMCTGIEPFFLLHWKSEKPLGGSKGILLDCRGYPVPRDLEESGSQTGMLNNVHDPGGR